jgi:hypothetical protein
MRKSRTNVEHLCDAVLEYIDLLYIYTCSCQTSMNIDKGSVFYGNVVVTSVTNIFDEEVCLNFV